MVRRLYAAGGRRFVVMGLPDLGRAPGVLHNETYEPAGVHDETARRTLLSRRLTALSKRHNRELAAALEEVRAEHRGTPIVFLDTAVAVASILDRRVAGSLEPGAWAQLGRRPRFDYGFDLVSLRSEELHDGQGTRPIQDRCYRGGYLGTRDPEKVCPEEPRAFFWDAVHPTTLTHCWLATLVQRDLASAGMLGAAPDFAAAREFCLDASVKWTGVAAAPEPDPLVAVQRSSRNTSKKASP